MIALVVFLVLISLVATLLVGIGVGISHRPPAAELASRIRQAERHIHDLTVTAYEAMLDEATHKRGGGTE